MTSNQARVVVEIGGRTYELISFVPPNQSYVKGPALLDFARSNGCAMTAEDGVFILEHRNELPLGYRRATSIVFPNWRVPHNDRYAKYLSYNVNRGWCVNNKLLLSGWSNFHRLVRRIS